MGRTAVVTGGASGMGLAISQQLAAKGYRVGVLDINGDAAERAAADLRAQGLEAVAAAVDVTDRAQVDAGLDAVRGAFGPIEVMVTSAGAPYFGKFVDVKFDDWERTIAINLHGTFHCLQNVVPDMVQARWGRIVTISSSSAQQGAPLMAPYSASKGGVIALTRTLARELAPFNITVNSVPPSTIDTPMSRASQAVGDLGTTEFLASRIPLGRMGTAEEFAAVVVFVCSDEASFLTGQTIGVNGGSVVT